MAQADSAYSTSNVASSGGTSAVVIQFPRRIRFTTDAEVERYVRGLDAEDLIPQACMALERVWRRWDHDDLSEEADALVFAYYALDRVLNKVSHSDPRPSRI